MDLTNIYQKINNKEYDTKLIFIPLRESKEAYERYQEDQARLNQEFMDEAIEAVGLKDHPKAGKAYALAWEHGHSAGYSDVLSYLSEFADLIL